jgi:CRP/FNR family transcriptional regulator
MSLPAEIKTHELSLSPAVLAKLQELGFERVFAEGEVIQHEEDFIRAIPIVLEGTIKVLQADEEGREMLLYYIRPGESCIMSFLGGMHHDVSKVRAVAEERTRILFVPADQVGPLIQEFPQWLDYIFRLYHKRFEELLEMVNAVTFKKTDERLLSLLQKKSELANSKTIHVTHEQLANELGTVRVVISRLLKQLEEDGQLTLGRNKIGLL